MKAVGNTPTKGKKVELRVDSSSPKRRIVAKTKVLKQSGSMKSSGRVKSSPASSKPKPSAQTKVIVKSAAKKPKLSSASRAKVGTATSSKGPESKVTTTNVVKKQAKLTEKNLAKFNKNNTSAKPKTTATAKGKIAANPKPLIRNAPANKKVTKNSSDRKAMGKTTKLKSNGKKNIITKKMKSKAKPKKPTVEVELTPEEKKRLERSKRNWEGNSNDDDSVDSGVLEENICYECGELTDDLPEDQWESIIVCDRCYSDYHKTCVGFEEQDMLPRHGWKCLKCKAEEKAFIGVKYSFHECKCILQVR